MMKRIVTLICLLFILDFTCLSLLAFDLKYTVHTSNDDINYKKKKALEWYSSNVDGKKFYFYDIKKHIAYLKNRALRWYENNHVKNKFYFVHPDHELAFTKKKSLRWFERNSK